MKGNLYKITNTVNKKVYIGKTYSTLEVRWRRHMQDVFRLNEYLEYKYNYKLYNAIRKHGISNFKIELINQFEEGELEQKEIEYIERYNSYNNGYNSTLGGDGSRLITKDTSDNIIKMYYDGIPISKIALYNSVHVETVRRILKNNTEYVPHVGECKRVIMYNKDFQSECVFESILEASKHIVGDVRHFRINIKKAFNDGIILYDHRWQLASDLVYEDKIFSTKFDKEAYIQGKPAYQPEGKQYYIVDGALDNINGVKKIYRCEDCGKEISRRHVRCMFCAQAKINEYKDKIAKPSMEQLKIDMETMNMTEIAKLYGRSRSTVSTWKKNYGL